MRNADLHVESSQSAERELPILPAALLALTTVLATASGFLREAAIAYRFGTSAEADAFSLMVYFVDVATVMAGIAIGSFAFVPVLARDKDGKSRERVWGLVTCFSIWVLLISAVLLMGIMVAPERMVQILYPGFSSLQQSLVTGLIRFAMPALLLTICGALISGALQADNCFNVGNVGRMLWNAGIAVGILALHEPMGGRAFAVSFYIGAGLSLAVQWWNLRRVGYHFSTPKMMDREVWSVVALAVPGVFSLGLMNVVLGSAERFLMSGLAEGSIAATGYAQRLMMLIGGISLAIQTVAFRSMVQDHTDGGEKNAISFSASIEMGAFGLFPLSLFLFAYTREIVQVVFSGGLFDEVSALLTARAARWYALSVVPGFILGVSVRACYAFVSPALSVWLTGILTVCAVGIDLALVGTLKYEAIPIGFLSGMLGASAVGMGISYWKGWGVGLPRALVGVLKDGLTAGIGIAVVRAVWIGLVGPGASGRGQTFAGLILAALTYGALYFSVCIGLGREPARAVWRAAMGFVERLRREEWHSR